MAKPGTRQQKRELGQLRKKYGTYTVTRRKNSENKKIKNAKITVFEGIEFKSGLEFFTYKHLKENGIDFVYEQHKFVIHPEFICGFPSIEQNGVQKMFKEHRGKILPITYTPDFSDAAMPLPTEFIIECKGFCNEIFPLKLKLFKKLLTDSGFKGTYYMPRNQKQVRETIALILKRRTNGYTGKQEALPFPALPLLPSM